MNPRLAVVLVALLAFAAKLYCAATTFGSVDVLTFYEFGRVIDQKGLISLYKETALFNHTPLVGYFAATLYHLAGRGPDPSLFAYLIRFPAIVADLIAVLALLWYRQKTGRPSWWALAWFAASPAAFGVSGYYGNVDSVVALGILLAGLACALERPALCGLFLGLACNVKIVPIFLAPVFFFHWLYRGKAWRFFWPAAAVALAGWAVALVQIPHIFLRNVFGYSSVWGLWGVTYFLRLGVGGPFHEVTFGGNTPAQDLVVNLLKLLVVGSVLWIAWRRQAEPSGEIFRTLALAWTIFFVFAPGFFPQYLVWPAGCLLLASEFWAALFLAASGLGILVFYTVISKGIPWNVGFTIEATTDIWTPWMVPSWLVLAAFLFSRWVDKKGAPTIVAEAER